MELIKYMDDLGIRVFLKEDRTTISECKISTSNGIWSVTEWFTNHNYMHQGYGDKVIRTAFQTLYDTYGYPEEVRYNWNGANEYVFDWLQRHFSPTSLLPIAEQKYMEGDCWEAHIYRLDKTKVFNYFLEK